MDKRVLSLNGKILPIDEAKVSVFDRGYMFGDGVYEVVRIYNGVPFVLDRHLRRLARSLDLLEIRGVDMKALEKHLAEVVATANLLEATIYIQITRGVFPVRSHSFLQTKESLVIQNPFEDAYPDVTMAPTILILVSPYNDPNVDLRRNGCKAIAKRDIRWLMCEVKSLNLLGNVFGAQAAKTIGVYEAIFFDDYGIATEGSHTNVFAVVGGVLRTAPLTCNILHGITRQIVLDLAKGFGARMAEPPLSMGEIMYAAEEVFLTGTTTEVMPVVQLNDHLIGDGKPGEITRKIQGWFEDYRDICVKSH